MKRHLVIIIATGLYSGYIRPFAGTWGTIPAWLAAYFLIKGDISILLAVTVITVVISIWSAGEAERYFGHDARKIVIDEWAGMFISVLFIEFSLTAYIIAFLAFRLFDVIKLPPARQFERLPGGWGVTMDDVAAGVYANIFVQLVLWGMHAYGIQ